MYKNEPDPSHLTHVNELALTQGQIISTNQIMWISREFETAIHYLLKRVHGYMSVRDKSLKMISNELILHQCK